MTREIRDYFSHKSSWPRSVQDGSIVFVSNQNGKPELYETDIKGSVTHQLTNLPDAHSVDGHHALGGSLLIASDHFGDERSQLWILNKAGLDRARGGTPAGPNDLTPLVVDPRFIHRLGAVSPDGTRFAVSPDGTRFAYATNRRNGRDFEVVVCDLTTVEGKPERTVHFGGNCDAHSFSPDNRHLIISRLTRHSNSQNLLLVDLDDPHAQALDLFPDDRPGYAGSPAWRDNRSFFFSTDLPKDGFAPEMQGIARFDLDSMSWQYLLNPPWDACCWTSPDGSRVLVRINQGGVHHCLMYDADLQLLGEVHQPEPGIFTVPPQPFVDESTIVVGCGSPRRNHDVFIYETARTRRQITQSPVVIPPEEMVLPTLELIVSGEVAIPMVVYRPPADCGIEPKVAVIWLHGGPTSQYMAGMLNPVAQYLVATLDCVLVAPNFRGSTGYGRPYTELDDGENRRATIEDDLRACLQWFNVQGYGTAPMVLIGESYGAYMALAGAVWLPNAWAAVISISGFANMKTYLERTPGHRREARKREYGDPQDSELMKLLSPYFDFARVNRGTRFLIWHGVRDQRVPVAEADEAVEKLRRLGVYCDYVRCEDAGHVLGYISSDRIAFYAHVRDFLAQTLRGLNICTSVPNQAKQPDSGDLDSSHGL